MKLNLRLQKLEQQLLPAQEQKWDLKELSDEELEFLIRHYGAEYPEEIAYRSEAHYQPYDELTLEERQVKLKNIYSKIKGSVK